MMRIVEAIVVRDPSALIETVTRTASAGSPCPTTARVSAAARTIAAVQRSRMASGILAAGKNAANGREFLLTAGTEGG